MQLHMKVVKGKPRGHCLTFPSGKFMFGRGPECDVRPNSDLISRQHCLLHVGDETASLRDLGSRNGTLVNGQLLLGERVLVHGDAIQLGPLVLEVLLDAPLEDSGTLCLGETALMNQETARQAQALIDALQQQPAESAASVH
jgi:pSer/pThr/pTyr-binding forkhead associated (FHA) protein